MLGFVKCLFGSGEDAGKYAVKASLFSDDSEKKLPAVLVFSVDDAECLYPATEKAIADSCAKYEYSFADVDGTEYEFKGVYAAALKAYSHAMESARGFIRTEASRLYIALRKGGKTRDVAIAEVKKAMAKREVEFRESLLAFHEFGGSVRSGRRKIENAKLDEFKSLEELKNYLKAAGFVG